MSDDHTYQPEYSDAPSDIYENSQHHQELRDAQEAEMSPGSRQQAKQKRLADFRDEQRRWRRRIASGKPLTKIESSSVGSRTPSPTPARPPPRSSALEGREINYQLLAYGGALNSQTGDGTYVEQEIERQHHLNDELDCKDTVSLLSPGPEDDVFSQSDRRELDTDELLHLAEVQLRRAMSDRDHFREECLRLTNELEACQELLNMRGVELTQLQRDVSEWESAAKTFKDSNLFRLVRRTE